MSKYKMTVYGHVQGVGFRYMAKFAADRLGVFGLVRNQADGSVYLEINGTDERVAQFIEVIKKSPTPSGQVSHYALTEDCQLPTRNKFSVSN